MGWGDSVHVAVGVVRNSQDQVLIAQRQAGVHLAGCWEFPGGKVEAGESVCEALSRELREELGIEIGPASPLIKVDHTYPERRVLLDVWEVPSYRGDPLGRQGQALRWVNRRELSRIQFPTANRPIATAARLPECYGILDGDSADPDVLAGLLDRMGGNGIRLIQLRVKALADHRSYSAFATRALEWCNARGIELLLNAEPELAARVGAHGVHLNAARLMRLRRRPVPESLWLGASCHDALQLRHAERIGVDFAVLAPVARTATHPNAQPLGWPLFAELLEQVNLPVYALGGLAPSDLPQARAAGAQGVAGITGFLGTWRMAEPHAQE